MNDRKMPTWMMVLLGLVALFFLGPPLLGLVFGVVGVLFALTAAMLKLGIVVGLVYVAWRLLRGMFGGGDGGTQLPASKATVAHGVGVGIPVADPIENELERQDRQRKAELDRELERAVRAANAAGAAGGGTGAAS